jgi:hypothetical protein
MSNSAIPSTMHYRTETEATNRLGELEAAQDLYRYTVDGYSAWRLLRFGAAGALQSLPVTLPAASDRWRRLVEWLFVGLQDLPAFLFPQRARYVIKTFSSALSEKESGLYKDVYFDDLLREIIANSKDGNAYFKIASLSNSLYAARGKSALVPITMTTAAIDLLTALFSRWGGPESISAVAAKIAASLQTDPSLQIFTSEHIRLILRRFHWSRRLYGWLLRRIRPEYVLVADTGEFAIWTEAKKLGIKTVEFQHGIYTPHHPDAVPALAAQYRNNLIMPDQLFLYGEYWKEQLEASDLCTPALVVVGNPRVDRFRPTRANYLASRKNWDVCNLVLTAQGYDRERLIVFMADFLATLKETFNYALAIKLHPIYDKTKTLYTAAFDANPRIQVLLGSEEPTTFELLARADLHLSISSACHYDALGLGVPTIVLPLAAHEVVLPLVAAGHAQLARTAQELGQLVMHWRELRVAPEVSEYYFKPGALQNITRELGLIE